jgi:hypothetical protein
LYVRGLHARAASRERGRGSVDRPIQKSSRLW